MVCLRAVVLVFCISVLTATPHFFSSFVSFDVFLPDYKRRLKTITREKIATALKHHAIKAYRENGQKLIALLTTAPELCEYSASRFVLFIPWGGARGTNWIEGWVGLRAVRTGGEGDSPSDYGNRNSSPPLAVRMK
jgi:hypothetical protein